MAPLQMGDPLAEYAGEFVVLKFGGHAADAKTLAAFAKEVKNLQAAGALPVIVHGGGPQIDELSKKVALSPSFVDGRRVTDEATLEVAEMVLARVGKEIGAALAKEGVESIAVSGRDASILFVERQTKPDLGYVGKVVHVNTVPLALLAENDFVPIVAPIGTNGKHAFNVNADEVAGAIAAALSARALLLLSNVDGVSDKGKTVSTLTPKEATTLIASGEANSGMIPKLSAASHAASEGVTLVRIATQQPFATLLSPAARAGTKVMPQ